MSSLPVSYDDVLCAAKFLEGKAHRTPVLTSTLVNERTGAQVFYKCENFQRTGSFKFRGACNAVGALNAEEKKRGVVAFSSGNHAQGVALAGRLLGVPAVIVMPEDAPAVKVQATRAYGAEVVLYDRHREKREEIAARLIEERGMSLIPPFDHPRIIAGQGTAAKELIEETGPLDALFVCVGGGGLISGCALAAKALSPQCRVIGVEPALGDDATRSFQTRTLQSVDNPPTIADGARTTSLGKLTFPIVLSKVDDMMTVSDAELFDAMIYLWERLKAVIEPTGALGAAGLFKRAAEFKGKRVGVIVSGGNLDVANVAGLRKG